jgi:hypothetical protein
MAKTTTIPNIHNLKPGILFDFASHIPNLTFKFEDYK